MKTFVYHDGYYDGWTDGREAMGEAIVEHLYYLSEYHVEVEPLVADLVKAIEDEMGRFPESEEDNGD